MLNIESGNMDEATEKWAKDTCINRTKNLAIIKFQLSSPTITRTSRSRSVTVSDIIATIGKMPYLIQWL